MSHKCDLIYIYANFKLDFQNFRNISEYFMSLCNMYFPTIGTIGANEEILYYYSANICLSVSISYIVHMYILICNRHINNKHCLFNAIRVEFPAYFVFCRRIEYVHIYNMGFKSISKEIIWIRVCVVYFEYF